METFRLFFAICISPQIRETLTQFQDQLRATGAHVKWVESNNLHITLKFLGATPETHIEVLKKAGNNTAAKVKPFDVSWSGFGAFPDYKRPKVIWAGVSRGEDLLEMFHLKLDSELTDFGFPPEKKKFKPHLTIGRVKSFRGLSELSRIIEKNKNSQLGEMRVNSFSLQCSTLTPSGPIYREISAFHLSG